MGDDSSAENTPNARIFVRSLSAQAQKFWILMKKGFIGRPYSVLMAKRFYPSKFELET